VIDGSLDRGWDRDSGGLFYFIDIGSRPTLQLESTMKLWWPHTEALYALLRALALTGDQMWRRWLDRVADYAFDRFSDPVCGEWFGYCDRAGQRTNLCKGNNYKGCFHVPRLLLLSLQVLNGEAS
jgi:N-acylglucosamine 2-epimerase